MSLNSAKVNALGLKACKVNAAQNYIKYIVCSIIISLSVINCAPKPPDVPACEHMGQRLTVDPTNGHQLLRPSPTCMKEVGEPECGHCVYIVSGRVVFIGELAPHLLDDKKWSEIRASAVVLPAKKSYAPLSAYIINACKKMKCSDDVDRFKVKLDSLGAVKDVNLSDVKE